MLSSQTKDEVTDAAVSKLREAVGGTLSVDALLSADESAVANAIWDMFARSRKKPLWKLIVDMTPVRLSPYQKILVHIQLHVGGIRAIYYF